MRRGRAEIKNAEDGAQSTLSEMTHLATLGRQTLRGAGFEAGSSELDTEMETGSTLDQRDRELIVLFSVC